ncbi:MAG: endonuclease domain-containing protein [Bacteroidales bacterium]
MKTGNMFFGASAQIFETANYLRNHMTHAELVLWSRLKNRNIINQKFRRQHPIGNYIVDFYCHKLKLIIEVDGEIHHDELQRKYDLKRSSELNNLGLIIMRFNNNEILYNLSEVVKQIQLKIKDLSPLQGAAPVHRGGGR